jgi:hypothetical protein
MSLIHISIGGTYKAGDQPPKGYNDWHEWARVQHKAGLRQRWCSHCGKWKFPQEDCGHDKSKRLTEKQLKQIDKQIAAQLKAEDRAKARRMLNRKAH